VSLLAPLYFRRWLLINVIQASDAESAVGFSDCKSPGYKPCIISIIIIIIIVIIQWRCDRKGGMEAALGNFVVEKCGLKMQNFALRIENPPFRNIHRQD